MSKKADSPDSTLGGLIDKLTPLKNEFAEAEPLRKVEVLWEIGDHLVQSGMKSSHNTGWKVQERSYISRDMLTKGFQVRTRWPSLEDLHRDLPNLADYSSFRDSFPYIVGSRRPDTATGVRILVALRKGARAEMRTLLGALRGGKAVPRKREVSIEENAALEWLSALLVAVDSFVFEANPEEVCGSRRILSDHQLDWISRACLALAGAIRRSDVGPVPEVLPLPWCELEAQLSFMLSDSRGSRFRSSIDRKRLATVASQLQWCKSMSGLGQLRAAR